MQLKLTGEHKNHVSRAKLLKVKSSVFVLKYCKFLIIFGDRGTLMRLLCMKDIINCEYCAYVFKFLTKKKTIFCTHK